MTSKPGNAKTTKQTKPAKAKRQKASLKTETKRKGKPQTNPNSLANLKPFQPGVSGNPGGRPKILSDAYREYLGSVDPTTGRTKAQDMAIALCAEALNGDVQAAKEIRSATEGNKLRDYIDDIADLVRNDLATLDDIRNEFGEEITQRTSSRLGLLPSKDSQVQEPPISAPDQSDRSS